MEYVPQPIDVSGVNLDPEMSALIERLAKNTHDIWAAQRMADGWRFGQERNDGDRLHPCLVDYEQLPESEKAYDRQVSTGVIKTLLKLGWRIVRAEHGRSPIPEEAESDLLSLLSDDDDTSRLIAFCRLVDPKLHRQPELYVHLGEKALRLGEPLLAYDVLSKGETLFDGRGDASRTDDPIGVLHVRLQQQRALALAQSGAAQDADRLLRRLVEREGEDPETLGLLGRVRKDLALQASAPSARLRLLREAYELYGRAYKEAMTRQDVAAAYYCGINAATLALLAKVPDASRQLADAIVLLCQDELARLRAVREPVPPWLFATLGEAELLRGDMGGAADWYRVAAQAADDDRRALGAMRRQARLILQELNAPVDSLDVALPALSVVVFTGHMIDLPGADDARFPAAREAEVRRAIARQLEAVNARVGYASAACGSDILFLEAMLERGGEINVVLPFEREAFLATSVDRIPGGDWRQRFATVLERAARVQVLGSFSEFDNDANYEFANLFLFGAAFCRSRTMAAEFRPLAVWDGEDGNAAGGTAAAVRQWQRLSHTLLTIRPLPESEALARPAETGHAAPLSRAEAGRLQRHPFLPMMFADICGYSRLSEAEAVRLSQHFFGRVGALIRRYGENVLSTRTQGDSLFLVFRDLETAVAIAAALRDETEEFDWAGAGLPSDQRFRIALDAGPCYSFTDPITGKLEFCGDYVIRAARLEPVTPPGEIYASETFAALAAATGLKGAGFDYAGQVELPKGFGAIPVFHLRRPEGRTPEEVDAGP